MDSKATLDFDQSSQDSAPDLCSIGKHLPNIKETLQGPVQPAVGDPASAGGLDQMTHRGLFQPRTFCDTHNFLVAVQIKL